MSAFREAAHARLIDILVCYGCGAANLPGVINIQISDDTNYAKCTICNCYGAIEHFQLHLHPQPYKETA